MQVYEGIPEKIAKDIPSGIFNRNQDGIPRKISEELYEGVHDGIPECFF